jgi:hypothetical protein
MSDETTDQGWQDNYSARQRYFESTIGALPNDILKMLNMTGVWPGGGLFVIPATRWGANLAVYTTFGLTNPDMPTRVRMSGFGLAADGARATRAEGKLEPKQPAAAPPGAAGYGYEILVITARDQQWPLAFLQWAVNAEIGNDAGLLSRVEQFDGLTVEKIGVGRGHSIDVLIAKAQPPLPAGTALPAGKMELLVTTVITDEEMQWSMKNGRGALLNKLLEGGVGQISAPGRQSVVRASLKPPAR